MQRSRMAGAQRGFALGAGPAATVYTALLGHIDAVDLVSADGGTAVAVMRNRCSIGDFTAATRVDHLVIDAPSQEGAIDE
jgi:hypothetical protein